MCESSIFCGVHASAHVMPISQRPVSIDQDYGCPEHAIRDSAGVWLVRSFSKFEFSIVRASSLGRMPLAQPVL